MSQGEPIPWKDAEAVAVELLDRLMPACERGAVAGSIRRHKPMVSDIEIVVEPSFEERTGDDLWGTPHMVDLLAERLGKLAAGGTIRPRAVEVHRADGSTEIGQRDGRSYKALVYRDMPVDLFIVRPGETDWGVILAIRTGPGDWNQRLVTDCQRFLRRVAGGKVYRAGAYVPCPEERDFFAAIGQDWIEPAARTLDRVAVHP